MIQLPSKNSRFPLRRELHFYLGNHLFEYENSYLRVLCREKKKTNDTKKKKEEETPCSAKQEVSVCRFGLGGQRMSSQELQEDD